MLVRRLAGELPALARLKNGENVTDNELDSIAAALNQADLFVTEDTLRKAFDHSVASLPDFLRHILCEAEQEGSSLNGLVLRLLQGSAPASPSSNSLRKFDDLDALAGKWIEEDAQDCEHHTSAFAEVDPSLWQ